jgi:SAM-dependent methyltransferase
VDAADHRRRSTGAWDASADAWDREAAAVEVQLAPATAWLVAAVAAGQGETVLELAAGPGLLGLHLAALAPAARVLVTDRSEAMVAAAERRRRARGIANAECRVVDAEAIDLPDASVDAVVCRNGFMLMADAPAALREAGRVLRPGGRLALAVWGPPERNPWTARTTDVLTDLGLLDPPPAGEPGMFALASPDAIRAATAAAGLPDPRVEGVAIEWPADSFDAYWERIVAMSGRLRGVWAGLDEPARARAAGAVREALEPWRAADGALRLPGLLLCAALEIPVEGRRDGG